MTTVILIELNEQHWSCFETPQDAEQVAPRLGGDVAIVPYDESQLLYYQRRQFSVVDGPCWFDQATDETLFQYQVSFDAEALRAQEIKAAKALVCEAFEKKAALITAKYPRSEVDSWSVQLREAEHFLNDATAATPMIDSIVAKPQEKSAFCEHVLAKGKEYASQIGAIIAWRREQEAWIEQASIDELVAYEVGNE